MASKAALIAGPREATTEPGIREDDLQLAERAATGDVAAQRQVVARLLPPTRRTVQSLLSTHIDREDAVQACALELLKAIKGFRGRSSLETWARRVVIRRCVKFLQKDRRYRDAIDPEIDPSSTPEAERPAPWNERLPRPLEEYLQDVPDIQRAALVLRHAFGYSLGEIASLTNAQPNTIKARLYHGGRRLRALIEADMHARSPEPRRSADG